MAASVGDEAHVSARYQTLCHLEARGSFEVYLAARREGSFERLYAQKRLKKESRDEPALRAAFVEQARRCLLIRHPNVVPVLDVGEDESGAFVIAEYVDGVSVSELLPASTRGPLPVDVCLRIARDVAAGLQAAHELKDERGTVLGQIHGDVSAESIMVGFDGVARLSDFGFAHALARAAQTSGGILSGTSSYEAPEQARGVEPDRRADLFALGVVLFELLAGQRFDGGSAGRAAGQRVPSEAASELAKYRKETPPELVELTSRLLAAEPGDRPASAKDVALALEAILARSVASSGATETATLLTDQLATLREERKIQLSEARLLASIPPERPRPVSIRPDAALSTKVRQRQLIALAALLVLLAALLTKLADRFAHPTNPARATNGMTHVK